MGGGVPCAPGSTSACGALLESALAFWIGIAAASTIEKATKPAIFFHTVTLPHLVCGKVQYPLMTM
jgi:hypothetical protein